MGSTGALDISVFHRLVDGNGTKPFRLVSWPTVIPLQLPACENAAPQSKTTAVMLRANVRFRWCLIDLLHRLLEQRSWIDVCVRKGWDREKKRDEMAHQRPEANRSAPSVNA